MPCLVKAVAISPVNAFGRVFRQSRTARVLLTFCFVRQVPDTRLLTE